MKRERDRGEGEEGEISKTHTNHALIISTVHTTRKRADCFTSVLRKVMLLAVVLNIKPAILDVPEVCTCSVEMRVGCTGTGVGTRE